MSLRKTKEYKVTLDFIRSKGIKVRHRRLANNVNGHFDPETNIITIQRCLKGTVLGCAVLFHELRHWHQNRDKRFARFMSGYKRYHPAYMKEVVMAEQDAGKFAKMMMDGLGFKYSPPELDEEELPELKEYWRKQYFES